MQDDFEVLLVKGLEVFGHECIRVEVHRAVAGVPTIGAITGAEINQRVARKTLLAKGARDFQRFLRPGERAMGLKITERPFWRHYGLACQTNILCQRVGWLLDVDDEHIQRGIGLWDEASLARAQIKLSVRCVYEEGPAFGADQKGRRHHRTKHGTIPSTPTRLHGIQRAAAIKLLRAFAEAQERCCGDEGERSISAVFKSQFLHQLSVFAANRDRERLVTDCDRQFARLFPG